VLHYCGSEIHGGFLNNLVHSQRQGWFAIELQETVVERGKDGQWLSALDFLWLEVTRKCNLKCIHCYTDSSAQLPLMGRMQYDDWQRVLEQGASLGCRTVQFIGGEPILYPHLTHLIADARVLDYRFIEVFTNGTLLNDSLFEIFQQFDVHLAFSVYAHGTEIHENITKKRGSFQKTLDGIRRALDHILTVRVGVTLMEANENDLEKVKAILTQIGIATVGVDRLRGVGRGGDSTPHI